MTNLDAIADALARAKSPEDVFGMVGGKDAAERAHTILRVYRKIMMVSHPDKYAGTPSFDLASRLFRELTNWKAVADAKVTEGTYGNGKPHVAAPATPTVHPQVIKTPRREYTVTTLLAQGDLADLYRCTYVDGGKEHHAVFKLAQSPADNDLLENEGKTLLALYPAKQVEEKFFRYLPRPLDTFMLRGERGVTRRVNVLQLAEGYCSLAEVMQQYPKGLDYRDVVWMLKRCLAGLGYVHGQGVVHGAILPPHVLVHPTGHGAKLVDWAYAVSGDATRDPSKRGVVPLGTIRAISKAYRAYYPPEVFAKKPATAQTDLYMLAKCCVTLLGGDITTKQMPDSVPPQFRAFLASCLIEAQGRRPDDAWALHEELDELLQRLVGKPRYRPLAMPAR